MNNKYRLIPFVLLLIIIATGIESCTSGKSETNNNDPLLTNTSWHLTEFTGHQITDPAPELYFDHQTNALSGFSGCNKLSGNFSMTSDKISLHPALATRYMCFGKVNLEKDFIECLSKTDSIAINKNSLTLFIQKRQVAVFAKK
ncbi:MAG: META domain-containing protein [Bacteroidetes bacterium]|nr:META domain-containing protein [Bacteroidota bacterium]MBK8876381.1 META domain-containing protein [Bacteroidota bacterium]